MHTINSESMIDKTNKTVGDFVAADYRIAGVFEKYGIDFCCGGQKSLAEISREKKLNLEVIQQEMEGATETPVVWSEDYTEWDLSFLIDHIVTTHHAYLNNNNGQITRTPKKLPMFMGDIIQRSLRSPKFLKKSSADLAGHLKEEEEVLFPLIKKAEVSHKAGGTTDLKDRERIKEFTRKALQRARSNR